MPGPRPLYQPTFSVDDLHTCEQLVRRPSAPQGQAARASLALLLAAHPALDNPAAARQLGKHENWVRKWRRTWVLEGFRLHDTAGRGRKPTFPPSGAGPRHRPGV
jgi:hypothetical protein